MKKKSPPPVSATLSDTPNPISDPKAIEQLDGANSSVFEEVQTFACEICGKNLETNYDLEKHMYCEHGACIVCGKIVESGAFKDIDEHQVNVHGLKYKGIEYYRKRIS